MTSGAFLQSKQWGDFQRSTGREVVFVEGAGLFVINALPFGWKYAFCPKGPTTEVSIEVLRTVATKLGVVFLRVEPSFNIVSPPHGEEGSGVVVKKSLEVSPSHTLITDLTKTEPDLLAAMHEKTRYNVRLAERKGVTISIGTDSIDDVWPIFEQTASRGQFRLHPKSYYEKMLASGVVFIATAKVGDQIVAANLMVDYAGTRTYLHGASGETHRNVMAPFLLHWELIKDAKRKGIESYDWWGVAPEGADESHPWNGITRFKLGFGGNRVDSPGTFDFVARRLEYMIYKILRTIRRKAHIS
ncbi:MAG: peptidoglycan bridge formation glycyltransferase FemA/FemB family protein [Candidatus Uhrbacteria bacterium]